MIRQKISWGDSQYLQSDELQQYIDWDKLLSLPRYAGGHDEQMMGLFSDVELIAHWNEGDYQGMVATCVKFLSGKYRDCYGIYNDYYGSCSGCDSWEDAGDAEVRSMCMGLSNGTYIFRTLDDVITFLETPNDEWNSWSTPASHLLKEIKKSPHYGTEGN